MVKSSTYSLKEVSQKLAVHQATILRWIDMRRVRLVKKKNARGHYVFTDSDFKKLQRYHTKFHIA